MRIVIHAGTAQSLINFRGELIKTMREQGLEVHATAPDLSSDKHICQQLTELGVTTHDIVMQRAGINPLKDLLTLLSYYKLFRNIKPDAVLGYTIKPVIYGTLAARLARISQRYVLITGLGYAFTGEAKGKRGVVLRLLQILYKLALRRAKIVFFQNPDDEALFRELKIVDKYTRSKVVNGSGIDTLSFNVVPVPPEARNFLLIARLIGDKGIREYVAAAGILRKCYPDAKFRLVGDVDANPDSITREELDKWVRNGDIEYLGALDDVRPAIAQSNVYVLPSYYREGTPRTILEAMAMGRPIITTDSPGCRETVIHGENGFKVPVRDVDALASAMKCLIVDPHLAGRMGLRSRELAVEKYDVHKVNSVMLKEMGLLVGV